MMIAWLFRRHKPEQAPAVKEAKRVQDKQFREWDDLMREVERVQTIAQGKARHPEARHW